MAIKGIDKAIKNMKARADEFSGRDKKLYDKIGEMASISISKNFEAEGRPKWKKRAAPYEWPILYMTGRGRARAERTALEWIHQGYLHINKIISTLYMKYHQYGCHQKKRPFVQFGKKEIADMKRIFSKSFHRK